MGWVYGEAKKKSKGVDQKTEEEEEEEHVKCLFKCFYKIEFDCSRFIVFNSRFFIDRTLRKRRRARRKARRS